MTYTLRYALSLLRITHTTQSTVQRIQRDIHFSSFYESEDDKEHAALATVRRLNNLLEKTNNRLVEPSLLED